MTAPAFPTLPIPPGYKPPAKPFTPVYSPVYSPALTNAIVVNPAPAQSGVVGGTVDEMIEGVFNRYGIAFDLEVYHEGSRIASWSMADSWGVPTTLREIGESKQVRSSIPSGTPSGTVPIVVRAKARQSVDLPQGVAPGTLLGEASGKVSVSKTSDNSRFIAGAVVAVLGLAVAGAVISSR